VVNSAAERTNEMRRRSEVGGAFRFAGGKRKMRAHCIAPVGRTDCASRTDSGDAGLQLTDADLMI